MDAKRRPSLAARFAGLVGLRKPAVRRIVDHVGRTLWKLQPHEPKLYVVYAGALTLLVACLFYSSARYQTLQSELWAAPQRFDHLVATDANGRWSAPLDDVFIHFDFARATARGYPFQWSEGNGYSSGGTSLLYPFVLALGYYVAFRGLDLMLWAGMLACVTVLATLLAARRLFGGLPTWASYLAPPALLGIGALDWTLFSGMEVSLFLAVWGGTLVVWDDLCRAARSDQVTRAHGVILGLVSAVLVATRPEAALVVALFGSTAALAVLRSRGKRSALETLLLSGVPGVLVLIAHSVANRVLTGDTTAAGALVKLEMHHPHLTSAQVWDAWVFYFKYQILRVTQYHFSELSWMGWGLWLLAGVGLLFSSTRRYTALLWASAFLWVAVVSLNGQVRWQNERYTMPAVAWLLLAAGLGLGALLAHAAAPQRRSWLRRFAWAAPAVALTAAIVIYQVPRFRDQVWFFGRASRNIFDQQVTAGWVLLHAHPKPRRVLLGDAGAIPYASDLPALDLIGLGGFQGLPFARATRHSAAAGLELIEHLPSASRPDYLALYPSWWNELPLWFGRRTAEVPVRGNVICGGISKVLYRADWSPLDHSNEPFGIEAHERLIDSLDVADLLSEKAHGLEVHPKEAGYVTMKILDDPRAPRKGLFDAGRVLHRGVALGFGLTGFRAGEPARLLLRVAPAQTANLALYVGDTLLERVVLEPSDEWQEHAVLVPADRVTETLPLRIESESEEIVLYHVFAVQGGGAPAHAAGP